MLTEKQTSIVSSGIPTIQIVALGFFMGSVGLFVAMAAIANWENAHTRIPMLVLLAAVSGVSMYMISFLFYGFFAGSTRVEMNDDEGSSGAVAVIRTSNILRYALLEAGCFLNAVVFLLEVGLVNFVVGLFGILLMVVVFPTRQRVLDTAAGLLD